MHPLYDAFRAMKQNSLHSFGCWLEVNPEASIDRIGVGTKTNPFLVLAGARASESVQIREMADDDVVGGLLCRSLRSRQDLRHSALRCRGHLVLESLRQLRSRESHRPPRALELRVCHVLRVPERRQVPFLRCRARAAAVEHIGEAFVSDVVHPLRSRLALQRVRQVIQGLRGLQQVLPAYGLPFEGVAAIIPGRLTLDPLSNFGDCLR